MKVAFGATILDRGLNSPKRDGLDGIGHYCWELLQQYRKLPDNPIILPYSFGQAKTQCGATLLPNYSLHVIKSLGHIKSDKFFLGVDLVHSTDQFIPIYIKKNTPLVATIMDVIPLSHQQFLKPQSRYIKSYFWKKLTQRADQIITISQFSKAEINKYLGFSKKRIEVIPLGVDPRYFKKISNSEKQAVLNELGIFTPFFLFLGSVQPRKNLVRLLEAHAKLPRSLAQDFPLIIVGKLAWDNGKILEAINKAVNEGRAKWLNYITESQKLCLLQNATGLAFVSLYEGFGLPITEAFASGLPVVTSNCTSMPEVAGNAALIVNPLNTTQITEALLNLIEDSRLVATLKIAGLERAQQFSWAENAKRTYSIYQEML